MCSSDLSPSWARLTSKVYQADPLVCKGCGGPLKIVAYITDELSIKHILDHLGLSPPEEKPPLRPARSSGCRSTTGEGDRGPLRRPAIFGSGHLRFLTLAPQRD